MLHILPFSFAVPSMSDSLEVQVLRAGTTGTPTRPGAIHLVYRARMKLA
jgi:hypothetical protein